VRTFETYASLIDGAIAKFTLDLAQIPCRMVGWDLGREGEPQGACLLVPDEHVANAAEILRRLD
jgi:hypothetical protein